jgi:hypothetical protein
LFTTGRFERPAATFSHQKIVRIEKPWNFIDLGRFGGTVRGFKKCRRAALKSRFDAALRKNP